MAVRAVEDRPQLLKQSLVEDYELRLRFEVAAPSRRSEGDGRDRLGPLSARPRPVARPGPFPADSIAAHKLRRASDDRSAVPRRRNIVAAAKCHMLGRGLDERRFSRARNPEKFDEHDCRLTGPGSERKRKFPSMDQGRSMLWLFATSSTERKGVGRT